MNPVRVAGFLVMFGAALAPAAVSAAPASAKASPKPARHRSPKLRKIHAKIVTGVPHAPAVPAAPAPSVDAAFNADVAKILKRARPHEGAVVVSDVKTGRILAWTSIGPRDMVSTPVAPAASVFKIATAATLLEKNHTLPTTRACYQGGESGFTAEDLATGSGKHAGDSCASLGEALGKSINLVFAKLAVERSTPEDLRETATNLGFLGPVLADRPLADSRLRIADDRFGFARSATGFWNGKVAPVSVLAALTTIANDGVRIKLQTASKDAEREELGEAISEKTAHSLTRMMVGGTRFGTSKKVFFPEEGPALPGIRVAGKTGTLIGGHPTRMYSWFGGFAPAEKPEVAIVVLLADDVSWTKKGNEVARDVLKRWFHVPAKASTAGPTSTGAR